MAPVPSLAALKRRFRNEPLIRDLEIRELIQRALAFESRLKEVKQRIAPADFGWYPWDSFGTLSLLDPLLTGRSRYIRSLIGAEPVLDAGCGDGSLAFFFESLGYRVYAVDHPRTNYNGMRGVRALRAELGSSIRIGAADLDARFRLPLRRCGLALFFGVLYHLKNPLGVLENLAAHARYCLLSTAIARATPDGRVDLQAAPLAYLADRDGLKGDETNYWIFSEPGLRVLVDRAGWDVCDWMVTGDPEAILWGGQRDERAFCLLRSRSFPPLVRTQLLSGWHKLESDAWRWTERRFSVAVEEAGALTLRCTAPASLLDRLGPLAVTARVDGAVIARREFASPGDYDVAVQVKPGVIEFETDKALPPDAADGRERGLIVRAIEIA